MINANLGSACCFDWVVPDFILWDIFGVSEQYYGGRKTYSLYTVGILYLN